MSRVMRLILLGIILIFLFKSSTFGWRMGKRQVKKSSDVNLDLRGERISRDVRILAQQIGERNIFNYSKLEDAGEYIASEFRACGYHPEFQVYNLFNQEVKNVIAEKKGKKSPEDIIIVGAHYDSVYGSPGADDNASAVAGLIELARAFSKVDSQKTIRFVAFTNEEPPFFKSEHMGSVVYAKQCKNKQENIKAAIILESIGYYSEQAFSQRYPLFLGFFYPNCGNFIALVSDISSRKLLEQIKTGFKKYPGINFLALSLPRSVPGVDFSDNFSFWQEGYPAIMVTDTAFYRNPNYHRATDLPETLDYEKITLLVNTLYNTLRDIDRDF